MLPTLFCLVSATDDLDLLEDLAEIGVGGFQVRDKDATTRELTALTRLVLAAVRPAGATVIVDDRVDVALAVGAGGTHLGAYDLPLDAARRVGGPDHVLGGTAREPGLARELVAAGATYLGVGPSYATSTKAGLPDPLGAGGVGAVAAAVDVPVIAIGGITVDRVPELLAAGAHGVAVVAAVSDAADPAAATRALLAALERAP